MSTVGRRARLRGLLSVLLSAAPPVPAPAAHASADPRPGPSGSTLDPAPAMPPAAIPPRPVSLPPAAEAAKSPDQPAAGEELPLLIRWMISPTRDGLYLSLPYIDTDPNTGMTYGIQPVWAAVAGGRVRHIHVGGLTYNEHFGPTGKYQYFYFPSEKTNLQARASMSQYWNREAVIDYGTGEFLGRPIDLEARFEYSRDGSRRFFGFGPASPRSGESNYTLDTINYRVAASVPVRKDSPFSAGLMQSLQADDVTGSFPPIPDTVALYPDVARNITERHHNVAARAFLGYDTRDSPITTTRGAYGRVFAGGATRNVLSEYNYYRYGAELRVFRSAGTHPEPRFIAAARLRFEQVVGNVPLWLLPTLGGKYTLRSYGEGRFTDKGLLVLGAEERCRIGRANLRGAVVSFWLDPFIGLGTVFEGPDDAQAKFFHPSVGAAVRIVGRPQVVGSVDFGYGQEGLKVFMDINYSF